MFVRRKSNRSGSTSVVVVEKRNGKTIYHTTIGVSSDENEIRELVKKGKQWINNKLGQRDLFLEEARKIEEREVVESLLNKIDNVLLNGTQMILNPVFDIIGFDKINDNILRHLVISRICQPRSKAATVDYLKSYFDEDLGLHKIYRYLDKLNNSHKDLIQSISVEHTLKILGGKIGVVFYDVTTLYFETNVQDELRKTGFSKDGKHSLPQVVLGLLISEGGYPLTYCIHEGNKYEGHTMLPIVEEFVNKHNLEEFVVVADSGLMNVNNVRELEELGYKYIVGAKIKNESREIKEWVLSQKKQDGAFYEYQKTEKCKLILGYSQQRAKKDAYNREKGVRKLEKDIKNGRLGKDKINKRGYNKFLDISNDIYVTINQDKVNEDIKWDGLKGYITNTDLSARDVYQQYSELWQVERAFRVTKGALELRPMFHFTRRRIEAHVCICFVAYKVYKELERILKVSKINLSVDKVLDIAKTITTIKVKLEENNEIMTKTLLLTPKHKSIERLFEQDFWEKFR